MELSYTQKAGNAMQTVGKVLAGLGIVDDAVGAVANLHAHFSPMNGNSTDGCSNGYVSYEVMQLSGIGATVGGIALFGLGKLLFKYGTPTEEQQKLKNEGLQDKSDSDSGVELHQ